jgi:hypothetical protein
MNKIYPVPAYGSVVVIAQDSHCSYTNTDTDEKLFYPTLSGRMEAFPAGTELEVMKVIHFPHNTWKALLKHKENGRMIYMADWEINEPKRVDSEE